MMSSPITPHWNYITVSLSLIANFVSALALIWMHKLQKRLEKLELDK